jgi:hypothetical protein
MGKVAGGIHTIRIRRNIYKEEQEEYIGDGAGGNTYDQEQEEYKQ